jgi:hypothetical protein
MVVTLSNRVTIKLAMQCIIHSDKYHVEGNWQENTTRINIFFSNFFPTI